MEKFNFIDKLLKRISLRLGLIAFIATGGGLLISTLIHERSEYKLEILVIFGIFFAISLADYFRRLKGVPGKIPFNRRSLFVLLCAFAGVTLTWFINHEMGYGAVIANGLVGIMAATFLPNELAGVTYTSSLVGMSSLAVIPSLGAAALGSLIVGIVLLTTAPIYAGFGGKGGTTAALSTMITRTLLKLFG